VTKDRSPSIYDDVWFQQEDLFINGKKGYHTYRIPALIVSRKGTILAFCEGRKYSSSDAGKIDLVLKRSFDGGKTWGDMQVIVADGDMTCGNPCPVVDRTDGAIWLPFCKNPGDSSVRLIVQGKAPRTIWITRSTDDGATWTDPKEITKNVKDPSWTWYATGPGHGIQLKNGSMVIPCDHIVGKNSGEQNPSHSHIIYSDDHGTSWKVGGIVDEGTNECAVVQTVDGCLYLNCRNTPGYKGIKKRVYAWSQDNGISFLKFGRDEALIEPICQASLVRFTDKAHYEKNRVLFSNPASTQREKLTIRISYDECWTWAVSKLLNKGPSGYSDLAIASDMTICCLYERGEEYYHEKLTLARFNIGWLTDGADKLQPKYRKRQGHSSFSPKRLWEEI